MVSGEASSLDNSWLRSFLVSITPPSLPSRQHRPVSKTEPECPCRTSRDNSRGGTARHNGPIEVFQGHHQAILGPGSHSQIGREAAAIDDQGVITGRFKGLRNPAKRVELSW